MVAAPKSLSEKEGSVLISDTNGVSLADTRCRLLYVVGQLALGGLERQLYYLLATLERRRYRPALVAWNLNPDEKYYRDISALNLPIYGLPSAGSPLSKLRALRELVRKLAPEVIHSYGFHTNFAAHYAASGTKTVAIGSLRSDFATVKKVGGRLRGALNARWPSYHISNSRACMNAAQNSSTFFIPKQFAVVRNGLDLNAFQRHESESREEAYAVGVGSLLPVKRWDRVLRAIREVNHGRGGHVRFRLAGDGPLRSFLEREAISLGLSESVEFLGAVHDVPSLLGGAQFVVHTSESEGCPNAVMEAMACGLPVIAMDAGDIPCLIEHGVTGFVIRQGDEIALADHIAQLSHDMPLRRRMGQAARAKAEKEFGLDRLVLQTLDAYRAAGWNDAGPGRHDDSR